jgi:hypothetical protein
MKSVILETKSAHKLSISLLIGTMNLVHVVAWRHAVELFEDGREGCCIVETAGIHDLGNVHVVGSK